MFSCDSFSTFQPLRKSFFWSLEFRISPELGAWDLELLGLTNLLQIFCPLLTLYFDRRGIVLS